jgi:hypothetical protein
MQIKPRCSFEDCEGKHKAKGYCAKHYQRLVANGGPHLKERREILPNCTIEGCGRPTRSWNLCSRHYYKSRTKGLDGDYTVVNDNKLRLKTNSVIDQNGCWIWAKSTWNGYGKTILSGKVMQAHRASWKTFVGNIPIGVQVNHKCHVRDCINPDHLYLGDQKQNMRDMKEAGRQKILKGSEVGNSKLQDKDILRIREISRQGVSAKEISQLFKTCLSNIRQIVACKTWKHVS